ncbi:MAG: PASTA domain-containing protein [Bacteroidales bacterium]|nr:PASTA domain-containing protein [Bacteroidales bacterium]MBR4095300.1 PASTA domain-containing protein [Bacteroidales bacterium]
MTAQSPKKGSKKITKAASQLKENILIKHIILAGCSLLVVIFLLFTMLKFITRHNQEFEVPSFINMTVEEAEAVARQYELRLEVTDSVYINRMAPGAIFRQNPEAASKVKKNRRILLTINANQPKLVKMPELVGYSLRQAQSELVSNQLSLGKLIYVKDIATNNVLGQLYKGRAIAEGEKIPSESVIDLKLGINETDSTTYIPEIRGIPYRLVREKLAENSLNLSKAVFDESVTNYADSLSAWVYRQVPAPSDSVTVRLGTGVTVYLSKVKEPEVPEKEDETQQE